MSDSGESRSAGLSLRVLQAQITYDLAVGFVTPLYKPRYTSDIARLTSDTVAKSHVLTPTHTQTSYKLHASTATRHNSQQSFARRPARTRAAQDFYGIPLTDIQDYNSGKPLGLCPLSVSGVITHDGNRSAVTPFRRLVAIPPGGSPRARILPSCPSLDRSRQGAESGFETRTFRSQPLNARNLRRLSAPLGVDQTDNASSICSASQPCIKPRQRESALIKDRQRLRNMQHVAASY
ncbi:hypothetical protein T265_04886 [Opisthorchis viverrini]|uniref:Uncharacterized protein n=1 Tax=Opisthorchis viverrini TaxID=6198 RepID=A0A075AFZ2_OPIVI|nr:hypothetical protein T265_04886 [Opisthorchis viverrini]KER28209.1 hypothetical protein T265_04886 [Opisthorchis viverrini]